LAVGPGAVVKAEKLFKTAMKNSGLGRQFRGQKRSKEKERKPGRDGRKRHRDSGQIVIKKTA